MKILLANPPCRKDLGNGKERYFVRAGTRWPFSVIKRKDEELRYVPFPFYLAYTAALLEKEGFEVFVIDAVPLQLTLEQFIGKAVSVSPDVILFETTTPTIYDDLKVAKELKEKTGAKIVLSSTHVTTFPKETLEQCEYVDFIMLREYELNFLELVNRLRDGKSLKNVRGIAYRNNGKIIINPESELVDLSKLPFPARHLFPSNDNNNLDLYWDGFCQYRPAIQMHASRGCPFRCNFCLWNQVMYENGRYRVFDAKKVVDEMEDVIEKYGAREIYFDDDSFTINKQHVLEICKEIIDRGLSIKWSCMGDAMVTDREMIDAMADAGCIGMKFGVESGDVNILKKIEKPVNLDKVKQVAKWLAEKNIKTHATFTFGLIDETMKTMQKTLDYAKELDVDSVQFSITTPFPGTRFYEELKSKNLLTTNNWEKYDGSTSSVVKYSNLTNEEIENFCENASKDWLKHKIKDRRWVLRQIRNLNRLREGQGMLALLKKIQRGLKLAIKS